MSFNFIPSIRVGLKCSVITDGKVYEVIEVKGDDVTLVTEVDGEKVISHEQKDVMTFAFEKGFAVVVRSINRPG